MELLKEDRDASQDQAEGAAPVVAYLHRRSSTESHSIEGLFENVRREMSTHAIRPVKHDAPVWSTGLVNRYRICRWARALNADVYHVTGDIHYACLALPGSRTVLTIHDLEVLDRLRGMKRWLVKKVWYDLPVHHVRFITVISQATKAALLSLFPAVEDRVVVIPDAISRVYQPSEKTFDVACPRILQIGTRPNKNLIRLCEALQGIPCKLHLIGKPGPDVLNAFQDRSIDCTIEHNLSDQQMYEAYRKCDIVSMPSTIEGFGMPILEGQWVERPILTSNCSSMPEVAGQGAIFVDPYDVADIRRGFVSLIRDSDLRQSIVAAGRLNRQRFSLEDVTRQYAELYRQVLASA